MAVSAARVGTLPYRIVGHQKQTITNITFDSAYVAGGEAVTAANAGLNHIESAHVGGLTATGGAVNVASAKWDQTNSKILLYNETPAELSTNDDVSTTVVELVAYGY